MFTEHPSQKPIALMRKLVRGFSVDNGVVLDSYMGSGTTGVACVQTGRGFIGIERDEHWAEIAAKRIQDVLAQHVLALDPA